LQRARPRLWWHGGAEHGGAVAGLRLRRLASLARAWGGLRMLTLNILDDLGEAEVEWRSQLVGRVSAVVRTGVVAAFRLSGSSSAERGEPVSITESQGEQNDKRGDGSFSRVSWPRRGCTRRRCGRQGRRRWPPASSGGDGCHGRAPRVRSDDASLAAEGIGARASSGDEFHR
jgi:hypothetical protein